MLYRRSPRTTPAAEPSRERSGRLLAHALTQRGTRSLLLPQTFMHCPFQRPVLRTNHPPSPQPVPFTCGLHAQCWRRVNAFKPVLPRRSNTTARHAGLVLEEPVVAGFWNAPHPASRQIKVSIGHGKICRGVPFSSATAPDEMLCRARATTWPPQWKQS